MAKKITIAIQRKGRLFESSKELLIKSGINFSTSGEKLLARSSNMNIDILADGTDMDQNAYVDYLQKNFLPDEDVYKPKKKKEQLKGLEKFYNEDSEINENSANN